jgi:hypothetical protein
MESNYRPTGELQGDSKPMPDRGTGTGMTPNQQLGGMSTDRDAVNRMGGMGGAAKSDAADCCMPKKP